VERRSILPPSARSLLSGTSLYFNLITWFNLFTIGESSHSSRIKLVGSGRTRTEPSTFHRTRCCSRPSAPLGGQREVINTVAKISSFFPCNIRLFFYTYVCDDQTNGCLPVCELRSTKQIRSFSHSLSLFVVGCCLQGKLYDDDVGKRRVMLCARALYIIFTTWYRNSTFLKCCKKTSLKLSSPPSLLCQCAAEAIWDAAGTHGAPEKMFLSLNLDHMTHPPFSFSFSKLVCCFWNCAAAALEKTSGTHPNLSLLLLLLLLLFLFLFCVSRTASFFSSSSSSSWNP